jgi:repressor LexA
MSEEVIRPTKKQRELLSFIEAFINQHGYSPSYREIMLALNYNSVATVALHINSLISRGHLKKRDHSARSLELNSGKGQTHLETNQVKAGEEKWLVKKVEYFFHSAEQTPSLENNKIDELYVLVAALKVLGIEGAAQSFTARLSAIKKKLKS